LIHIVHACDAGGRIVLSLARFKRPRPVYRFRFDRIVDKVVATVDTDGRFVFYPFGSGAADHVVDRTTHTGQSPVTARRGRFKRITLV